MITRWKQLSILLVLSVVSASAQQIQINKDNKTIAITTTGNADALADTAVITIGFQSFGKDQDGTYADATRLSNSIMQALTSYGVPKEAIQSASQELTPLDSDDNRGRYTQGFRFEFSQKWEITVPATAAANTLHVAILAGANDSGTTSWQLQKTDELEAQAAAKALEHARQIAKQMADGLGVKLGALVYASNQTPQREIVSAMDFDQRAPLNGANSLAITAKRNLVPVALSPERITRTATVYAVFAIE